MQRGVSFLIDRFQPGYDRVGLLYRNATASANVLQVAGLSDSASMPVCGLTGIFVGLSLRVASRQHTNRLPDSNSSGTLASRLTSSGCNRLSGMESGVPFFVVVATRVKSSDCILVAGCQFAICSVRTFGAFDEWMGLAATRMMHPPTLLWRGRIG